MHIKKIAVVTGVVALTAIGNANASWKPGTPYLVSETDMEHSIERISDHSSCLGVPKFGHDANYEEFIVFDCSIEFQGSNGEVRLKSTKGSRPGAFKVKVVKWLS
jgi:hypothetical protein